MKSIKRRAMKRRRRKTKRTRRRIRITTKIKTINTLKRSIRRRTKR
jgi:hypothetical protein